MRRVVFIALVLSAQLAAGQEPFWADWSENRAQAVGVSMYAKGRVGNRATIRLLETERAISYKLAATWMTPDVVAASARLLQLRSRLPIADAADLVAEAETIRDTVIMVEIDPDEGSGVIPLEWEAFLQPKGNGARAAAGTKMPTLREMKALAGVQRRNYDYDRFWLAFRLVARDGAPLFAAADAEAELVVRIHEREGRVSWPIPASIRSRMLSVVTSQPSLMLGFPSLSFGEASQAKAVRR